MSKQKKWRITATEVAKLSTRETPYEMTDPEVPGFTIRVQPSGVKTYYLRYRTKNGQQEKHRIGSTREMSAGQARDEAKAALGRVLRGEDPDLAKKKVEIETLGEFIDKQYGPWVKANRKSGIATVKRLEACFKKTIWARKLTSLNPWDLEKWRSERLREGKAIATLNRDIVALKAALSKAVEWEILQEQPLTKLKPGKVDSLGRIRFLSDDEEKRLRGGLDARENKIRNARDSANRDRTKYSHAVLPSLRGTHFVDHLKPMVLLTLNTGLRRGELFNLEWTDIDFERAILTVRGETAKSSMTRHVPLNSEAVAVLEAWRAQNPGDGYVFKGKKGGRFDNVTSSWEALLDMEGVKIADFRWHDMRHHFASQLVMAGVDLNMVRELLGHADLKMTLRYAHLAPKVKADAVERLVKQRDNVVAFLPAATE